MIWFKDLGITADGLNVYWRETGEGEATQSSEGFSGKIIPWSVWNGHGKSCSQKWVTKASGEKTSGSLVCLCASWRNFLCMYNFLLILDLDLKGNLYSKGKGQLHSQSLSHIHKPMLSMLSKCSQCFLLNTWHGWVACRKNNISSMPFQLRSVADATTCALWELCLLSLLTWGFKLADRKMKD